MKAGRSPGDGSTYFRTGRVTAGRSYSPADPARVSKCSKADRGWGYVDVLMGVDTLHVAGSSKVGVDAGVGGKYNESITTTPDAISAILKGR